MKITVYKCDRCGDKSENTKGWYKIAVSSFRILVASFGTTAFDSSDDLKHICGEECLNKILSYSITGLVD